MYAETQTGNKLQRLLLHQYNSSSGSEKIKVLSTDNGGEYLSNDLKKYLSDHGIQHQLTVAYTPQQNGVAERTNRALKASTSGSGLRRSPPPSTCVIE